MTTLSERALGYLREGPRPALDIVRDVIGLTQANATIADKVATALLGADPRFTFDLEGRWSVVPEPAWHGVPIGDVKFAVVDVETTGMRAYGGDRITEIAIVHVDGPRVQVAFDSLINPDRPIPYFIQELTSITDRDVAHAPKFEDVADQVVAALAGRVFVAHNALFDWRFVTAEVERAQAFTMRMPKICTVRLTRRLVPELTRRSLDAVMFYFGLENDRRHRAGGDALVTAKALLRLIGRARDRGVQTWEDLHELGMKLGAQ